MLLRLLLSASTRHLMHLRHLAVTGKKPKHADATFTLSSKLWCATACMPCRPPPTHQRTHSAPPSMHGQAAWQPPGITWSGSARWPGRPGWRAAGGQRTPPAYGPGTSSPGCSGAGLRALCAPRPAHRPGRARGECRRGWSQCLRSRPAGRLPEAGSDAFCVVRAWSAGWRRCGSGAWATCSCLKGLGRRAVQ